MDCSALTPHLGAEVHGIDLSAALPDRDFERLRGWLCAHSLLLLREQHAFGPRAQVDFSRRFGELENHVLSNFCLDGYPEIFVVSNIVENGRHIGAFGGSKSYHSDLAYLPEPSLGSVFRCVECPDTGGGTAFVSMFAAFDALSDQRKRWLRSRRAIYDYVWEYERRDIGRPPLTDEQKAKVPPIAHPCVRVHPETGREALFLSEFWVRRFEDMSEEDSRPLIRELLEFATDERFTYEHRWRPGDVLVWDNRSSLHKACPFDEENARRLMHRTTIRGERPVAAQSVRP
jgi:taurine dioxygenase